MIGAWTPEKAERISDLMVGFKLPTVGTQLVKRIAETEWSGVLPLLLEVFELEASDRRERRVERLLRASRLPASKTMEALQLGRFSKPLLQKVRELAKGDFLDRADNVLCFGLPGVGKSHVAAAIGHELVRRGRSVYYAPTYEVVQDLLAAKRDLMLPKALRRYDAFDLVVLDDLGYVQQSQDEAEVLFTLLSERYERRSVMLTSNLAFADWGRIFVSPRPRPCPAARRHAPILRARQLRPARGDRERHTTARPARGGLGARQKGPTCARQKGPTEKSLEAEVSTGVGARRCRLERSPRGAHLGLSKRRLATFPAEFRLRRRYLAIPPGRRPQGCGQGASWSRGDARRWPPGWVPFGEQRRVLSRERPARAGAARIGR